MEELKLHRDKEGEYTIVEGEDSFVGQLFAGCKGKLIIKNPLFKGGKREIKQIAKVKEKKER